MRSRHSCGFHNHPGSLPSQPRGGQEPQAVWRRRRLLTKAPEACQQELMQGHQGRRRQQSRKARLVPLPQRAGVLRLPTWAACSALHFSNAHSQLMPPSLPRTDM
jgi:hypothetical protein